MLFRSSSFAAAKVRPFSTLRWTLVLRSLVEAYASVLSALDLNGARLESESGLVWSAKGYAPDECPDPCLSASSQGHVAAYGFRERNDESTSAVYAPVGFSGYQYRECLDPFEK